MAARRPPAPPRVHLGVTIPREVPAPEAKARSEEIATAVVGAAAEGPVTFTLDGHCAIVWRDAHGWQNEVHPARPGPTMRTRTSFGGVPTVEEATCSAVGNLVRSAWSQQVTDDAAFIAAAVGVLCRSDAAVRSLAETLAQWTEWQRMVAAARAAGHGLDGACELAHEAQRRKCRLAEFTAGIASAPDAPGGWATAA